MNNNTPTIVAFPVGDRTCYIDECDRDLSELRWYIDRGRKHLPYVARKVTRNYKQHHFSIHRLIMERVLGRKLVRGERIDHIDRNPLNNCRSNLRIANASQNAANAPKHRDGTNPYRGVYQRKNGRYSTKICVNRRVIQLGTYDTPEEAYETYKAAALKYHGEFARTE